MGCEYEITETSFLKCPYFISVVRARKGVGGLVRHERLLCALTGLTCLVDPPDKTQCMRFGWYQDALNGGGSEGPKRNRAKVSPLQGKLI